MNEGEPLGILRHMADTSDEALFNNAYCQRVRDLRDERGWTADQMATALGIPPDRYRKYETRSPMPAYLVERFALIVGRDVEYVLTGKAKRLPVHIAGAARKRA
jgi:transcriptional regulator with XRE-family HTH domain